MSRRARQGYKGVEGQLAQTSGEVRLLVTPSSVGEVGTNLPTGLPQNSGQTVLNADLPHAMSRDATPTIASSRCSFRR